MKYFHKAIIYFNKENLKFQKIFDPKFLKS